MTLPSSEDYRQQAQECTMLAKQTPDPIEQQELLELAARWLKLADYKATVEQNDKS